MDALLEVRDLRTYIYARRGVVKAVDGATFAVRRGETLGIVGESGSGKSMTCLSILRLVPEPGGRIVGGQILFDGEDLLAKSPEEMRQLRGSRIAMILQDPMASLNPAMTVGEQIAETLWLHRGLRGRAASRPGRRWSRSRRGISSHACVQRTPRSRMDAWCRYRVWR